MKELIVLFGTLQMQVIVIMIAVDVVLGIIASSIVKKDLVLGKLADFMKGPVLAYVLGFAVIEMVGQALPKLGLIVPVVFVLIVIALLVSILKNLGRLGLPLPSILKK